MSSTPSTFVQILIRNLSELSGPVASPAQIAINWARQQPRVILILGARILVQVNDNLGALKFTLSEPQLSQLNDLKQFKAGLPIDFLTRDSIRELIFGDTFVYIDKPRSVV